MEEEKKQVRGGEEHHGCEHRGHSAHSHEHPHGHDCGCQEHTHERGHSHGCDAHDHGGCSCGHDHEHGGEIEMGEVLPLAAGLALFFAGLLLPVPEVVKLICYLAAYLISGWKVLLQAGRNILRGELFDETFLMAVASLGACAVGEVSEGAAVMLFYNVGELLQDYAVGRSRKSIRALMDIRPDTAQLLRGEMVETVPAQQVEVGQSILVRVGERIPLDGVVTQGSSQLDTAALTGEALPRPVEVGDGVLSGCINLTGVLTVRVSRSFANSTASKILELTEHAAEKKARAERFITRFARVYTPAVVGAAALIALLPPLLGLGGWSDYLYRALNFLVVSCPCALVISVPLGYFAGIGRASRQGILIKGGGDLEKLARARAVALDKTGTLTTGTLSVREVRPVAGSGEDLLELAALAEAHSTHPIAQCLRGAYGRPLELSRVGEVTELAGQGVRSRIDGRLVLAGSARLLAGEGLTVSEPGGTGSLIHLAREGVYLGFVRVDDQIRPSAFSTLQELKKLGVQEIVMLTGDQLQAARAAAEQLGIHRVFAGLLPADKLGHLEGLLAEQAGKGSVLFLGDGINDAPVLARADVGIAMGGVGSDAAMEAADVVIMDDAISKVADAIRIARRTHRIILENIVFSIGVKAVILLLSALGYSSLWAAVFADVGVCLLAVLNAMRLMAR